MVELKGSLANASLLSVVQSIGEQRRTGTLHLTHDPATGRLAFDGGRLVGAGCGDEHGLQAVAHCVLDFDRGDYKFDEGAPTIERTLDLGPADVTKLITRIGSRDFGKVHGEPEVDHPSPSSPCPLLGFADDREHHYSRSTAMHRCYAGGAASLVSAQEQRDLCLSGRFSTCPRFRTDEATILTAAPVVVAAAPEPAVRPVPLRAVAARAAPPPMPPGVAARLAAASQMQMSSSVAPAPRMSPNPEPLGPDLARGPVAVAPNGAAHEPELDRSNGSGPSVDVTPGQSQVGVAVPRRRAPAPPSFSALPATAAERRRQLVLRASAAAATLAVLMLTASFILTAVRGGPLQTPGPAEPARNPTPAIAAAARTSAGPVDPLAAARTSVGPLNSVADSPTSAPASGALAAPASRAAAPTSITAARAASGPAPAATSPPDASSVLDVRFASGAAERWLEHEPYAGWSDGAYRLVARDAMRFVAVGVPTNQPLEDVIVSATFRKTGGPPGGGYGLIVRDQGSEPLDGVNQEFNAYVLETGDLGEYGVWRREGDRWIDLVPWTRSSAVRSGGSPNDLVVRAVGAQLTFSVNGSVVAQVSDDTFGQGGVGLFVGGDSNAVALDRFNLERPD